MIIIVHVWEQAPLPTSVEFNYNMEHLPPVHHPAGHVLSSISTADLVFDSNRKQWIQRQSSKFKLDMMPVNVEVAWEGYRYLGKPMPSQEVVNKSIEVRTAGIADTGCTSQFG